MNRALLAAVALLVAGGAAVALLDLGDGGLGLSAGVVMGPDRASGGPPSGASWWRPTLVHTLGDPASSGLPRWTPEFDATPLAVHDFDEDGWREVVAHGSDGHVYVFSARTGKVLATVKGTLPASWHVERVLNGAEAARLGPGQPSSLVVGNHAGFVGVWDFDAKASTADKFVFTKRWEVRLDKYYKNPGMDSKPVLADLDGDGTLEILAQIEEQGLFALNADGTVRWAHGWGGGNASPRAADLDGDGRLEAIFASDGGSVSVFAGASGRPLWSFKVRDINVTPGAIPVAVTVAELDGAPPMEVVFTARDAHARDPARYLENHVAVVAVHQGASGSGELLWARQFPWAMPLSYTQIVPHDVTGDGVPELFGMDWNTIGHRPGEWEHLGNAHVFALDARGNALWVREVESWWSNKDLLLGDFDGDGRMDIVANAARDGYDGFWRLDARTGEPQQFLPVWPWKVQRAGLVAQLQEGGPSHLLVPVMPVEAEEKPRGAILVFDLGRAVDAPWPGRPPP